MPYTRIYYHLIWATRDRLPVLGGAEIAVIAKSFQRTIGDLDLIPHAVGFMPDHVHLVITLPPKVSLSEAIKRFKGASSRAVNQLIAHEQTSSFAWQGEYGALTFGDKALPQVCAYVEHQVDRHRDANLWTALERIA